MHAHISAIEIVLTHIGNVTEDQLGLRLSPIIQIQFGIGILHMLHGYYARL